MPEIWAPAAFIPTGFPPVVSANLNCDHPITTGDLRPRPGRGCAAVRAGGQQGRAARDAGALWNTNP